jgi:hypothetical protein
MVGREREWAAITGLLDAAASRPGLLVVEGEPGMDKTLMLDSARDAARDRGYRVLETRPSEAESALAYAGLHDLFETLGGNALADLPAPQRGRWRSPSTGPTSWCGRRRQKSGRARYHRSDDD